MTDNPVLFLDIDGVLNSTNFYIERSEKHELDSRAVKWLSDLVNDIPNLDVVISSSYRKLHSLDEINQILQLYGATFTAIDVTPNLNTFRGVEIQKWLSDNRNNNFKKYAIVDDDSDMMIWQQANFILTDGYWGLSPNHCYRIKRLFK